MWYPNRRQWLFIWIVAAVLGLALLLIGSRNEAALDRAATLVGMMFGVLLAWRFLVKRFFDK